MSFLQLARRCREKVREGGIHRRCNRLRSEVAGRQVLARTERRWHGKMLKKGGTAHDPMVARPPPMCDYARWLQLYIYTHHKTERIMYVLPCNATLCTMVHEDWGKWSSDRVGWDSVAKSFTVWLTIMRCPPMGHVVWWYYHVLCWATMST